jgi:BlaI family penicillinase repressor
VMTDKGLLTRKPRGRGFIYSPKAKHANTTRRMLADLLGRAFDGSASLLVSRLLEETHPTHDELAEIRSAIAAYERQREDKR